MHSDSSPISLNSSTNKVGRFYAVFGKIFENYLCSLCIVRLHSYERSACLSRFPLRGHYVNAIAPHKTLLIARFIQALNKNLT